MGYVFWDQKIPFCVIFTWTTSYFISKRDKTNQNVSETVINHSQQLVLGLVYKF